MKNGKKKRKIKTYVDWLLNLNKPPKLSKRSKIKITKLLIKLSKKREKIL